jgi:hypothetical protein
MLARWTTDHDTPQIGIRFVWTVSGPKKTLRVQPGFFTVETIIRKTIKNPYDRAAVRDLAALVSSLRRKLPPCNKDEPINLVAHSLGTMIVLAALKEGMTATNVILLNSPLDRKKGADTDFARARSNVSGKFVMFYSTADTIVTQVNSTPKKEPNGPVKTPSGVGKVDQINLGGDHSASLTSQLGYDRYGPLLAFRQPPCELPLYLNKDFAQALQQILIPLRLVYYPGLIKITN